MKPMPSPGNVAAKTALPHPPNTNQKVPTNSAIMRFVSVINLSLYDILADRPGALRPSSIGSFSCRLGGWAACSLGATNLLRLLGNSRHELLFAPIESLNRKIMCRKPSQNCHYCQFHRRWIPSARVRRVAGKKKSKTLLSWTDNSVSAGPG